MKEWPGQSLKYTEIYHNIPDQLHQVKDKIIEWIVFAIHIQPFMTQTQ